MEGVRTFFLLRKRVLICPLCHQIPSYKNFPQHQFLWHFSQILALLPWVTWSKDRMRDFPLFCIPVCCQIQLGGMRLALSFCPVLGPGRKPTTVTGWRPPACPSSAWAGPYGDAVNRLPRPPFLPLPASPSLSGPGWTSAGVSPSVPAEFADCEVHTQLCLLFFPFLVIWYFTRWNVFSQMPFLQPLSWLLCRIHQLNGIIFLKFFHSILTLILASPILPPVFPRLL